MADATAPLSARIAESVAAIRGRTQASPPVGIILGTGLGGLAKRIQVDCAIEYADIPHFPLSTVESHTGRLLFGTLGGKPVVAMQGRFHRYEGYTLQQVTFPVRVMKALGVGTLVVSNACGGMNPLWAPGELMLIREMLSMSSDFSSVVTVPAMSMLPMFTPVELRKRIRVASLTRTNRSTSTL